MDVSESGISDAEEPEERGRAGSVEPLVLADIPLFRGERFGKGEEFFFFAGPFFVARVASDRNRPVVGQEFKTQFDTFKRSIRLRRYAFLAPGQISQIINDQARGIGEGNGV